MPFDSFEDKNGEENEIRFANEATNKFFYPYSESNTSENLLWIDGNDDGL